MGPVAMKQTGISKIKVIVRKILLERYFDINKSNPVIKPRLSNNDNSSFKAIAFMGGVNPMAKK